MKKAIAILIFLIGACSYKHSPDCKIEFDLSKETERFKLIAYVFATRSHDWKLYELLDAYQITVSEDDKYYILQYRLKRKPGEIIFDGDCDIYISKDLKEEKIQLK